MIPPELGRDVAVLDGGGLAPNTFEVIRGQVDARLQTFFDEVIRQTNGLTHEVAPVIAEIQALTMRGGKRLRPALVVAAMECVVPWQDRRDAVLDVCAAVELLQTYLLIHDDWMDGDSLRRGGPTVHVALTERLGDEGRGAAAAILAGDLASALAQSLLSGPSIPVESVQALMQAYVRLQQEVMLGQTLDILNCPRLEEVYDLKTGSYTTRGPVALGHALAGGDTKTWNILFEYSKPLGIAFQLRDDLLGSFGDTEETGKEVSSDLKTGKRTAPVVMALAQFNPRERDAFLSLLGSDDEARVAEARAMMTRVGAVELVETEIAVYRNSALLALEDAALRPSGKNLLAQLAYQLTSRSK